MGKMINYTEYIRKQLHCTKEEALKLFEEAARVSKLSNMPLEDAVEEVCSRA